MASTQVLPTPSHHSSPAPRSGRTPTAGRSSVVRDEAKDLVGWAVDRDTGLDSNHLVPPLHRLSLVSPRIRHPASSAGARSARRSHGSSRHHPPAAPAPCHAIQADRRPPSSRHMRTVNRRVLWSLLSSSTPYGLMTQLYQDKRFTSVLCSVLGRENRGDFTAKDSGRRGFRSCDGGSRKMRRPVWRELSPSGRSGRPGLRRPPG